MSGKADMHFSKSVKIAIQFMLAIIDGKTGHRLPVPDWKEFYFFDKIKTGSIISKGIKNTKTDQFERIERKISFLGYKGVLLAEVLLHGNKFTSYSGKEKWYPTFWRVVEVKFRKNLKAMPPYDEPQWYQTSFSLDETPSR